MAKKPVVSDNLQTLKQSIKAKELDRLYIFHGEEVFLLNHYFGQMKKILLDDLTESFNFHRLNNETFSIQDFADSVENLPMMADHTLVHVDEIDLFKLPEAERNKVAEILSDIPDYCTVVFTYQTVAWKPDKRLKKLWQAIDGNATIVEFAKQGQRELIARLIDHWQTGFGHKYNPDRETALALAKAVPYLEDAMADIAEREGRPPRLIATGAGLDHDLTPCPEMRRIMEREGGPYLLLLGTGWGLTKDVIDGADFRLPPIYGREGYNHLSVRSAASIIIDRLLGER